MQRDEERFVKTLEENGAVITNTHVVFTSGKHGNTYINKDALYLHTGDTAHLCQAIAQMFENSCVDAVVAPEKGGIILSQWTAHFLSQASGNDVLAVYAEKETVAIPDPEGAERKCYAETGAFVFTRGYGELLAGKRVLVVEDILNTGDSAKKVVDAAHRAGGFIVGLGALWNRGNVTAREVGQVKPSALITRTLNVWEESECPLCKKGVPLNTKVGKGKKYRPRTSV